MILMLFATCHLVNGEDPLHSWHNTCDFLIGEFLRSLSYKLGLGLVLILIFFSIIRGNLSL